MVDFLQNQKKKKNNNKTEVKKQRRFHLILLQTVNKESNPQTTTRLKYLITSVDGDREKKTIREFIDTYLLARDARSLREEVRRVAPDVELVYYNDDVEEGIDIPIDTSFFWPDAGV